MSMPQEAKYSETERKAGRKYRRELFGSIAIYVALLIPSIMVGAAMDAGVVKTGVLLSPMIGFFLMTWAVARQVGRMDEYQRGRMLETLAIAAAITAGLSFTYGFLENAGYPRLSMFMVWGVMGCSWLVAGLFRCWVMRR
jgi:hypothetical protein